MIYKITPQLYEKIKHFAKFPQTGVSLRQMVMFEELPIRLAHRVKELDELPHNLSEMQSITKVKQWYAQSFQELVDLPPPEVSEAVRQNLKAKAITSETLHLPHNTPNLYMRNMGAASVPVNGVASVPLGHRYYTNVDDFDYPPEVIKYNEQFVKTIENIKRRHDPVVTTVAYRKSHHIDTDVQAFLDRFYMSRIGIRMLIGQHVALHYGPPRPDYCGVICIKTNLSEIAREAVDNARFICEDYYGLFKAPEVQLHCRPDIEFMYVPSHLSHMMFELLKNSLRAVVETFGTDADNYPPIKLIVTEGKEDITIKISDEGGGIPRSGIPLVWTYMYTTAEAQVLDPDFNKSDFKAPMAGFGYGLPISRLVCGQETAFGWRRGTTVTQDGICRCFQYARYFGGDLKLISMEGYGTDVYMHLNRLSNSDEPLM
ncbi:mitochondrial branched-chain alpha-ketoacid dehydrogenase kinase-domain-containing protein [Endogone sp. FLAS-F59071]|nr:mitochondrial branched-chain alpha-ketoacid dehydrogenase kinase-domain-containing protein [Endogone sp. FLAS-F59071]|eukprot:RUS20005.1 mitochondrial branched-chain alpha-ketoacid dehydrogenase kinase-domain-containing protein [Endogone sp. FLAS-F59071]